MSGIWVMVTLVALGGMVSEIYKYKLKLEAGARKGDRAHAALSSRLEEVERRLANIESLVVEREKEREFDRAL